MQMFRIVKPGFVDRILAFDSLPERFLIGVGKSCLDGLPRHWKQFCDTHYVLDYLYLNKDKERWGDICAFLKRVVEPSVRLTEKIEDMSIPMAANTRDACNIEPEDVPVIPVPIKFQERPETITPNPVPIEPPKPVEVQKLPEEKKKHLCKRKGRGMLEEQGVCPRCDQIRESKLQKVA